MSVTGRRELAATIAVLVAGAATALLAASRVWLVEIQARPQPLPEQRVTHTGAALAPALPALALVALAGAGGVLATRGLARRLVGAVVLLGGLGMLAQLGAPLGRAGVALGWIAAAGAGAVVVGLAGVSVLWRGGRWPAMGGRYRRGGSAEPLAPPVAASAPRRGPGREPDDRMHDQGSGRDDAALWDALDRGDDPTDRQ